MVLSDDPKRTVDETDIHVSHDRISPHLRLHQVPFSGRFFGRERPSTLPLLLNTAVFPPQSGKAGLRPGPASRIRSALPSLRQARINPHKVPGSSPLVTMIIVKKKPKTR